MTDPLTFALAVIALLATPGPTNTLLFTAGATSGLRALRLLPAEITGYLASILTIGLVIAPLTADAPVVATLLRLTAAGYLVAVALRLWRQAPHLETSGRLVLFRHVFVTTLLNPKGLLFALGIVPLHDANAALYLLAFSIMVVAVGGSWVAGGFAVSRGLLPAGRRSLLPRVGAAVIAGFACYLVLISLA